VTFLDELSAVGEMESVLFEDKLGCAPEGPLERFEQGNMEDWVNAGRCGQLELVRDSSDSAKYLVWT